MLIFSVVVHVVASSFVLASIVVLTDSQQIFTLEYELCNLSDALELSTSNSAFDYTMMVRGVPILPRKWGPRIPIFLASPSFLRWV